MIPARTRLLVAVSLALALGGCASMHSFTETGSIGVSTSLGESESGYTYVPVDPFPVKSVDGDSCKEGSDGQAAGKRVWKPLLEALPDNAVRMLVEQFDRSGGITYGTSKAGAKGESYRVTVDYINADTINVPVAITRLAHQANGTKHEVDLFSELGPEHDPKRVSYRVQRIDTTAPDPDVDPRAVFNIPVYVGVGLRVSANVTVIGANANISGIGVIGYEAEAERLRGSLVVQTLGINGKAIAAALPIQSELNRTTAQNAIVAVGSIKSLLYAQETITSPRVVGLYLPFPGGKPLVNALISELSKNRADWPRPCTVAATATTDAGVAAN
ncbi:MAG: hypothetical protein IPG63_17000 [Xanthomonadales bacterium]|nr:hypothetical protein [Xanthomonadales bacterium]